jgi:superfamily II DNA/RNA helicase
MTSAIAADARRDAPPPTFHELGLGEPFVRSLSAAGIIRPFPIQAATLPDSLAGRDVLGRGSTGSGKTLAFALPVLSRLRDAGNRREPTRPRALVLVPTRELASQVEATFAPLAAAVRLRTAVVFGGVGQRGQVRALRDGVDVLVACPGRLEDLLAQGHVRLDRVEVAVLDEADLMADLGFLPAVRRILDQTPPQGQRLLFSATLDNGVDVLVRRYLSNPITHSLSDPAATADPQMEHHIFEVQHAHKAKVVRELASGRDRSLLFTRTKHGARKLAQQLTAAGVPAAELHGNLAQNARASNLAAFRSGAVRVLVATDIAARGIHVDDVELVVHVDPPAEHKAYLHRSGRTARAGAAGTVVTVATGEQMREVRALTKKAAIVARHVAVTPGALVITELTGPPADLVAPSRQSRPIEHSPAERFRRPRGSGSILTASTPGSSGRTRSGRSTSTRRNDFAATATPGSGRSPRRGRSGRRQRSA